MAQGPSRMWPRPETGALGEALPMLARAEPLGPQGERVARMGPGWPWSLKPPGHDPFPYKDLTRGGSVSSLNKSVRPGQAPLEGTWERSASTRPRHEGKGRQTPGCCGHGGWDLSRPDRRCPPQGKREFILIHSANIFWTGRCAEL